jgi:hypothetical protein
VINERDINVERLRAQLATPYHSKPVISKTHIQLQVYTNPHSKIADLLRYTQGSSTARSWVNWGETTAFTQQQTQFFDQLRTVSALIDIGISRIQHCSIIDADTRQLQQDIAVVKINASEYWLYFQHCLIRGYQNQTYDDHCHIYSFPTVGKNSLVLRPQQLAQLLHNTLRGKNQ